MASEIKGVLLIPHEEHKHCAELGTVIHLDADGREAG